MNTAPLPQRKRQNRRKNQAQPQPTQNKRSGQSARKRRRKANANNPNNGSVMYSPNNPMQNVLQPQALGVSTSRQNMVRTRMKIERGMKLTDQGVKFLKCAFSAADFDGSGTYGVPDNFSGRSSAVKHRLVTPAVATGGTDLYFIQAPCPGYAYFLASVATGTPILASTNFVGVQYSDFNSMFGLPGTDSTINVQKFRMVSNHFEIVPTTNANNWSGNIQVFKIPLQVAQGRDTTTNDMRLMLNGIQTVNSSNADMYSGPFNLGAYVGSFQKAGDSWNFTEIWKNMLAIPETFIAAVDFGSLLGNATGTVNIPGFDNNFETTVIKISGITAAGSNSFLIRTWSCVEYQFCPGSVMYEMQNLKCTEDRIALALYRRIILELPTAVCFLDNANFWTRVLSIIRQISGGLSVLPGPYGAISGGVNAIATGLETFVL